MSNVTGRRSCIPPTRVSCPIYSGLYSPSEWVPVGKRIQAKREELAKRRDMLVEANMLLEDQRDDASEADMLLHAERYGDPNSHPQTTLTPRQQQLGGLAEPVNPNANNFVVHSRIYIPDRASFAPGFVVHHFGGLAAYSVIRN